jgi:hypothetical protein
MATWHRTNSESHIKIILDVFTILTLKTAGSFISFQIPSTPLATNSFTSFAHHNRVLLFKKSGNATGPGQHSPTNAVQAIVK